MNDFRRAQEVGEELFEKLKSEGVKVAYFMNWGDFEIKIFMQSGVNIDEEKKHHHLPEECGGFKIIYEEVIY